MVESPQRGSILPSAHPSPPRNIANRLKKKCGQFLRQIIDCFIAAKDPFYPPFNFLVQQINEQNACTILKLWSRPWQRALQLGRANCPRCSPFGRLMVQSCSISGSQAEQLTTDIMEFPHGMCSDEDLMIVLGPVQWVSADTDTAETTGASAGTPRLAIRPTNHPGFVRVLQERQANCPHPEPLLFSAEDVRQFNSELALAVQPRAEPSVSGPATSFIKPAPLGMPPEQPCHKVGIREVDRVPCLHVPCWPSEEFFTRCRKYGWPSEVACEDMRRFGVHLVPVGAPGSATEHHEWRWSFSRSEVITVMELGPIPRCALKTAKACRKLATLRGKTLKSYFLKMALFWLCQTGSGRRWESITQGVLEILDYLKSAIISNRLSCFYWKDINILKLSNPEELQATLRTIAHIRKYLTELLILTVWPFLTPLLREPQARLTERQMRVFTVRHLICLGVEMSLRMHYSFKRQHHDDWRLKFAALSSNAAEVRSMFNQLTTPWLLRRSLLLALIIAPPDVRGRMPLTPSDGGSFVWDAAPLMELLTEADLADMLQDPNGVRAWLRRQRQLPETERLAGLPADLGSPRDLCDLLLNTPLLMEVLRRSVPSSRQRMGLGNDICHPLPEDFRPPFEATGKVWQEDAVYWILGRGQLFHSRLGVERELALRRTEHYVVLLRQFCDDPATRAEHDRLRSVMPDSWQLRPFMLSGAV